jgi:hypothetical protein
MKYHVLGAVTTVHGLGVVKPLHRNELINAAYHHHVDTGVVRDVMIINMSKYTTDRRYLQVIFADHFGLYRDNDYIPTCSLVKKKTYPDDRNAVLIIFDNVETIESHPDFDGYFTDIAIGSHNAHPDMSFSAIAICGDEAVTTRLLKLNGGSKVYRI